MRALVCGGAGFIGSHLVDRLIQDGHSVTVVDDLSHGRAENLRDAYNSQRCELVKLDLTDPALVDLTASIRPEVIYNLAAQIDVRASVADPIRDATVNVLGTVAVLEAARVAGARKVVLASSVAIYGPPRALPVTEETPVRPLSPYAVSKLAGEFYLRQYLDLHGVDSTTLVLTNTYGPRQDPHGEAGVVAIFADAMLSGRPTRVFGDGGNTRDYVFVDDVVTAFVAAGMATGGDGASGRRINIATGVATSDLQLHAAVARAVGDAPEPEFAPARLGDLPHMVVDPATALRELGWAPSTPLDQGIERTVTAIRAARTG